MNGHLSTADIKKHLFNRNIYLLRVIEEARRLELLPVRQREAWLKHNQAILLEMLDGFVDDSFSFIEGYRLELDNETIQLSADFMTNLNEAKDLIQAISSPH